jgi:hypothetical protein
MWLFKAKQMYITKKADLLSSLYWCRSIRKNAKTFFTTSNELRNLSSVFNAFDQLRNGLSNQPFTGGSKIENLAHQLLMSEDDEIYDGLVDISDTDSNNTTGENENETKDITDYITGGSDENPEENPNENLDDINDYIFGDDNLEGGSSKSKSKSKPKKEFDIDSIFDFELDDLLEPIDEIKEPRNFDLLCKTYANKKIPQFKLFTGGNAPDDKPERKILDMITFKDAFKTYRFILSDEEPGFVYFGELN